MKNVYQLAKLSRRIPRLVTRISKRLQKKGLTENEVASLRNRMAGCGSLLILLQRECTARNIGGPAKRDARPLKLQRKLGLLPAIS